MDYRDYDVDPAYWDRESRSRSHSPNDNKRVTWREPIEQQKSLYDYTSDYSSSYSSYSYDDDDANTGDAPAAPVISDRSSVSVRSRSSEVRGSQVL
ncbi:hypothetical protein V1264_001360 [Littorina saxatilis]|uniref:Uncharacterized protein n=1 Tax=Littorina saxatilis TaxID=31220 RepID=A0AAN9C0Z9_9CAEN